MNPPVSKNFGGLRALNEVDLTINRQEIVALIGPNGAGKTTFFNCITGIYLPTEGTVQLHLPERNGKPASSTTLNGMKPNEITSLGMARTFQNIRLFPSMTVLENVMIGRHCRTSAGIAGAVFQDSRTKAEEQATIDRSYELAVKAGAEGGKLLGAGGGGFMLFYVKEQNHQRVRNALSDLKEMPFKFDNKGTTLIHYNKHSLKGRF